MALDIGMPCKVVARLVLFAVSSGLLFGVDLGSIGGGLEGMAQELGLTPFEEEAIVAGCKGGAIFGCLFGGAWMAVYGRKRTMVLAIGPFILGPGLLGLSRNFPEALLGRLIVGFGVGATSVASPCYLSEVSSASIRGALVACYEVAIAFGFLLASLMSFLLQRGHDERATTGPSLWRYEVGLVPVLATVPLIVILFALPESPRWLLGQTHCDAKVLERSLRSMKTLEIEGAKERVLDIKAWRRSGSDASNALAMSASWSETSVDLMAVWDDHHVAAGSPLMPVVLADEEHGTPKPATPKRSKEDRPSVRRILRGIFVDVFQVALGASDVPAGARRGLALAVGAAVLNQACASSSVLEYAQRMLKDVGIVSLATQNGMATAVAGSKFVGVLAGLAIINRVGRKPLLGVGGALCALGLALVSVGSAYRQSELLLIGMSCFILVFVATWGIGYWVVVTEVTAAGGPRYGAAMQAAATAMLFVSGWLTSFTFVSVTKVGPWALMGYAVVAVLMAVFAFGPLPETRGLSLEECAALLAGGKTITSEPSDEDSDSSSSERRSFVDE